MLWASDSEDSWLSSREDVGPSSRHRPSRRGAMVVRTGTQTEAAQLPDGKLRPRSGTGRAGELCRGSCPKSVMAPQALWMLELTSQRGLRERTRHRVSAPVTPGMSTVLASLILWEGMADRRSGRNLLRGPIRPAVLWSPRKSGVPRGMSARAHGIPAVTVDPLCCGGSTTH